MSNGSKGFIDFDVAEASGSGSIDVGSIPVSWLFSTSSLASEGLVNYTVSYDILIQTNSSGSTIDPTFTFSGTTALNSPSVHGSGSIAITQGGTVLGYEMSLDTTSNVSYSVDIPQGSTVNLNNTALSAVPEPASLLMIPGAAAVLFLRRRKRKA